MSGVEEVDAIEIGSVDELRDRLLRLDAEAVENADGVGVTLRPVGGGTHSIFDDTVARENENITDDDGHRDATSRKPARVKIRMNRIVEHEAQDLTVTCEAGCTLADVQAAVGAHGQRLALEVAAPERATVGGIVAAAADGFIQAAFGPVRDQVLGVQVVLPNGDVVRAGGRVVKNVTGYDLTKLFTGSRGRLGFITEVTFRLRAMAHATRTVVVESDQVRDAVDVAFAARGLAGTVSGLVVAKMTRTSSQASTPIWQTIVRLEGRKATVDAMAEVLGANHETRRLDDDEGVELWRRLSGRPNDARRARVRLRPSRLVNFVESLVASSFDDIVADVANGRVDVVTDSFAGFQPPAGDSNSVCERLEQDVVEAFDPRRRMAEAVTPWKPRL